MSPTDAVAVVGLGAMGSRIAARLVELGRDVVVWNRSPHKADQLVRAGARLAATPAEAAAAATSVVVMVSDAKALLDVADGPRGLLRSIRPGHRLIQMSTVGPAAMRRLQEAIPEGVDLIDAPVFGSMAEAETGHLTIFVGASRHAAQRSEPLLSALGTPVLVGQVGHGSAAKLVANIALLGTVTVLAESLALARCLDIPDPVAFEILDSTPLSQQAQRRRQVIEERCFPTRYALSLACKDSELIVDAAAATGRSLRVAAAVSEWFKASAEQAEGPLDYTAVIATILDAAGDAA